MKEKYFITVQRCSKGIRGILCNKDGYGYSQKEQHTKEQMHKLLGNFGIIFNPKSELFNEENIKQFDSWIALPEYNNILGIGCNKKGLISNYEKGKHGFYINKEN